MATAVLNTKVGVVENKVLDDSSLVTATISFNREITIDNFYYLLSLCKA